MKVVLVDEVCPSCHPFARLTLPSQVHILNETRGATLEVIISRMKLRSGGRVRFVLLSATVPNIGDLADWIGLGGNDVNDSDDSGPARIFEVS